jgi:hypothetical protein
MNALEETWSRTGFDEPSTVERLLVRGALAGALSAGALALLGEGVPQLRLLPSHVVAFTAAVLMTVLPRQSLSARLALGGVAAMLPVFLPWTPSMLPYFFTVPLGMVLAQEPASLVRKGVSLVGPSFGAAWCLLLERWLSARHLGPLASMGSLALFAAGLFIAVGASLAWVSFAADAMEPKLVGQPKVRLAWLRLQAALKRLPQGEPRAQLQLLAAEGAARCVKARAEHDELASTLDETSETEARESVTALKERIEETADAELKAHLGQLLRVHQDTLEQLDGLRRKVERLEARTAAEAGWLETAAFSVELAPRNEGGVRELAARLQSLAPRA